MMNEIISNVVNNTINSFDIPFCIIVNIATYLVIKLLSGNKKKYKFSTWKKRITFVVISIIVGVIYCLTGSDYRIVFNSVILAPVSWSWIFKPICSKLNIDYNTKTKDK